MGVDVSCDCLQAAEANAHAHHLVGIAWRQANLLDSNAYDGLLDGTGTRPFNLIISNPPYIRHDAALDPTVTRYDPARALYGGDDGLAFYRSLAKNLPKITTHRALIVLEIGATQARAVTEIFHAASGNAFDWHWQGTHHDTAGLDRVVCLQLHHRTPLPPTTELNA